MNDSEVEDFKARFSLANKEEKEEMLQQPSKQEVGFVAQDINSLFLLASSNGRESEVRRFLDSGVNIEAKNSKERSALFLAAADGHESIVQLLLNKGADLRAKDKRGETALHIAAWRGHDNVVELLLSRGIDIEAKNSKERSALYMAAANGQERIVQLLLRRGADLRTKDKHGETALHIAAWQGHKNIVELLLSRKADIEETTIKGETPLFLAAASGHWSIVQLLLDSGADLRAKDKRGERALHIAARQGHKNVVELLLSRVVDIEAKTVKGETPLFLAAANGRESVVQLLLENGADANVENARGEPTLIRAVGGLHDDVLRLLLKYNVEVKTRDENGRTALHIAASRGYETAVQLLLNKGAEIAATTGSGQTALHLAAREGHTSVVQLLLTNGADVTVQDDLMHTALYLAAQKPHMATVELLVHKERNAMTRPRNTKSKSFITINGNSLDPNVAPVAPDASQSNYVLVKTSGPLTHEQGTELAKMQLKVHEYVSENMNLYGYKETDLDSIRRLEYVIFADIYAKQFKIPPSLKPAALNNNTSLLFRPPPAYSLNSSHTVDIMFHQDVNTYSKDIEKEIMEKARVNVGSFEICHYKIRLTIQDRYLDDVATIDAVRAVQEVHPVTLRNNVAREILNVDVEINQTVYRGNGEVVCVADSGLDDTHEAFEHRIGTLYPLGRPGGPNQPPKTDDPDGHGTHVAGSVLGNGESNGVTIQGTAPEATVVFQSLLDSRGEFGGIPHDLTSLFQTPYENDNVRVHTNSWGQSPSFASPQLSYGSSAAAIDQFVWDNNDMVILFAAGNDAIDHSGNGIIGPAQIGAEAAAKNCITVGASENDREDINATYGGLNRGALGLKWLSPRLAYSSAAMQPISNHQLASNPDGVAAFSSRGPTSESRFKPDVVAPGTCILSAWSRMAKPSDGTSGVSNDPKWGYMSGTSMATPLVAGCVAVLREALLRNRPPYATQDWSPSAALIKALLINGSEELTDQYNRGWAGPCPNYSSGFGRVNLANSIIVPPYDRANYHEHKPLKKDDEFTDVIQIPKKAGGASLKITLVWTDPAASLLQNDLDLIVRATNGTERHGNMGTSDGYDGHNNVEQIHWTDMPPGPAIIIIHAFRITSSLQPQPFAYAWRIS